MKTDKALLEYQTVRSSPPPSWIGYLEKIITPVSPCIRTHLKNYMLRIDSSVFSAGIQMKKQQTIIIALALWFTIVSVLVLFVQHSDLENFFIISLLGFLMIMLVLQQSYIRPNYQKYIWYSIVAGMLVFSLIVAEKVLELLGL
jgi:hypothetical protein